MDRAIEYSKTRISGGTPLSEKQGYTHKLIVPHVARLEAARAFIEETSQRIDEGEGPDGALNTEGAIAKYLATESGNHAAEDAIQALGGYGFTREYTVEKIKRDVRITTIYEGTSEILEMTIARDRWQEHLKSRGQYYLNAAQEMNALAARHPEVGAATAALGFEALAGVFSACQTGRLTRNQHVLFRLGELVANVECAGAMCRRAAAAADGTLAEKANRRFDADALAVIARVFAREAAMKAGEEGMRWVIGSADPALGLDATLAHDTAPGCHPHRPGRTGHRHDRPVRRPLRLTPGQIHQETDMTYPEPIAIVGISAIMPDAPDADTFWGNIRNGVYSISDVPTERWDPDLYYDPDMRAEDKTYSKIGGWVREFPWEPMAWKLPLPPNVTKHFDDGQKWAVSAGSLGAARRRLAGLERGS